jgi:hypothetical protein
MPFTAPYAICRFAVSLLCLRVREQVLLDEATQPRAVVLEEPDLAHCIAEYGPVHLREDTMSDEECLHASAPASQVSLREPTWWYASDLHDVRLDAIQTITQGMKRTGARSSTSQVKLPSGGLRTVPVVVDGGIVVANIEPTLGLQQPAAQADGHESPLKLTSSPHSAPAVG